MIIENKKNNKLKIFNLKLILTWKYIKSKCQEYNHLTLKLQN